MLRICWVTTHLISVCITPKIQYLQHVPSTFHSISLLNTSHWLYISIVPQRVNIEIFASKYLIPKFSEFTNYSNFCNSNPKHYIYIISYMRCKIKQIRNGPYPPHDIMWCYIIFYSIYIYIKVKYRILCARSTKKPTCWIHFHILIFSYSQYHEKVLPSISFPENVLYLIFFSTWKLQVEQQSGARLHNSSELRTEMTMTPTTTTVPVAHLYNSRGAFVGTL